MIGTIINAAAVAAGGLLGLSMAKELPAQKQNWLKTAMGILALYLGFRMVWLNVGGSVAGVLLQLTAAVAALLVGAWIGRALGIQKQLSQLGRYASDQFSRTRGTGRPDFSAGLVACSILYSVGPLAVVGPLQEALRADPRVLLLKAAMDGLASMAFARVFGAGAVLAALPVLAFQGTLTLAARAALPWIHAPAVLQGFSAVAGLLVAATSLVILDVKKVPLGNYLPALVLGPLLRLLLP